MLTLYNDDTGYHAEIELHPIFSIRPVKEEMDKCDSIQHYAIRLWTILITEMTNGIVDKIIEELERWKEFNNE